jgi:hypothetical protein
MSFCARTIVFWSTLEALLGWQVDGQPILYEATGTREQIQPVIDQFKHDIIYGVGGSEQNPPSILGRFNVATLDDVADKFVGSYWSPLSSGGLTLLGGPWVGLYVGGEQYPSFSPPNGMMLDTLASSQADLVWVFNPDPHLEFQQNAFGAVFANVGQSSPASIEGIFVDLSTFAFPVQPTAGTNDFSFIGIIDPQQTFNTSAFRMQGTYYQLGEAPPPPTGDSVVVDDIIVGMAPPLPEPSSGVLFIIGLLGLVGTAARKAIRMKAVDSRRGSQVQPDLRRHPEPSGPGTGGIVRTLLADPPRLSASGLSGTSELRLCIQRDAFIVSSSSHEGAQLPRLRL